MPDYWYTPAACSGDDDKYNICTFKKPYFMIYIYDDYKRSYNNYIENRETIARRDFQKSLDEVLEENKETEFIKYYDKGLPFGTNPCTMNKICWHIENIFKHIRREISDEGEFDYKFLRHNRVQINPETATALEQASKDYAMEINNFKKLSSIRVSKVEQRNNLKRKYQYITKQICPDEKERLNIILDLNYSTSKNNQFMWDTVGHLIVKRIEELHDSN